LNRELFQSPLTRKYKACLLLIGLLFELILLPRGFELLIVFVFVVALLMLLLRFDYQVNSGITGQSRCLGQTLCQLNLEKILAVAGSFGLCWFGVMNDCKAAGSKTGEGRCPLVRVRHGEIRGEILGEILGETLDANRDRSPQVTPLLNHS
jgi:hypothetical protein